MKIYKGSRTNPEEKTASDTIVMVNGNMLSPTPSLKIVNHFPTGFAWGYYGSGPAQLALAILLDFTQNKSIALKYYQDFKSEFVAAGQDEWELTEIQLQDYLLSKIKILSENKNKGELS